jgi:type I restriction enzyme S subunit
LTDLVTKGTTPTSIGHAFVEDGINFVKVESITTTGQFIEEKFAHITPACHAVLGRSQLQAGDILFSIAGALGRTGFVTDDILPANTNQALAIIRLKRDVGLLPKFVLKALETGVVLEQIEKFKGGVAQQNLSLAQVRDFQIALPPLAEQQRIVGLLDEAFEGLATAKANAEKNLQNARALFESHLQSAFTQRGPGWVETTLSRATEGIFTGPFGSLLHKSDYITDGIPLVNPAHITGIGIEPDLRKTVSKGTALRLKNYIMSEGDIVIGRRGEMGRCALVTEVEDGWLCGTGSFFIKPSSRCDTRYLVRFLRSDSCKIRLEKIAGGAVMPNLSNTDLGNLTFDLPPLDRQKAIVEEIDSLHEETQRLARLYERKLAALEALKKSLLHQAFTGAL